MLKRLLTHALAAVIAAIIITALIYLVLHPAMVGVVLYLVTAGVFCFAVYYVGLELARMLIGSL
jgi:uncharacterized membrane protein YvlD (DUF360 family)